MRVEDLIVQIKAAQFTVMKQTFDAPPADYAAFRERLGIHFGLQSVLNNIEEEKQRESDATD